MDIEVSQLTYNDFKRFFGVDDMPMDCEEVFQKGNFQYRRLGAEERDRIILDVCKRIESPELTVAGKDGKVRWEKGWNENLEDFKKSGCDVRTLVPKYIHPERPIRLDGDYAKPIGPNFELDYYNVFRRWLVRTYLDDAKSIYEFGCGTGYNLVELAELYTDKDLHGADWVSAPKEILRLASQKYGYKITGHIFDMFSPDESLTLPRDAVVLAIGALEQLGTHFEAFLQYILRQPSVLFVHVDSITELYDENALFDYLALKFDRRRKYLDGYLTRLQELEREGRIEIVAVKRSPFGSLYHDGYSLIVWRSKS